MNVRPARLMAACTTVLLVAGLGTAVPADAAAKAKATKTGVSTGRAVAGSKVTLTATVSPRAKVGTVRFTAGGKTLRSCSKVTVRSGKARCTTTFASAGKRSVVAKYSGKAKKYKASTGRRTVSVAAKPAVKAAAPKIVGSTGSCTTTTGALVAVDFAKWGGPVVRGCDTTPTKGNELLTTAGFGIDQVQRQPSFVCRLGHPLFASAKHYPTTDPCVNTPPSNAYWSYWLAAKGSNTWTYATLGAFSQTATNGQVQAWTFGATNTAGTTGKPLFTPNQVRADLPASAAKLRALQARVLAAPTSPDLDGAADYLVDNLVDGDHYEQFGQADVGLTLDGALALAAIGSRDDALGRITEFIRAHVTDYTLIGGSQSQFADGGSAGKTALLAVATGNNPRSFGGVDLIKALGDLTCTKADELTQCGGKGAFTFTPSLFGHTLAVLAELRAGVAATAPVAYLLSQQASSGAFYTDSAKTRVETDTTAMAAMALALVPGRPARTALAKALKWLAGQQQANGSFPGASGDSVNSAALSIQALTLDAESYASPIAEGRQFVGSAQNGDGGFDISATDDGSDIRASAQAVGGATLVPFGSVLRDVRSQDDAAKGAEYLVDQLTDGSHYTSSFVDGEGNTQTFDDQGLTADGVFALLATGGNEETVEAMVTYLEGQVGAYADPAGDFGGPYSGGLAKLALVAESTGGDPHAFGDTDLLKIVKDKVCTAAIAGDFSPCTAKGDFYNAFSQISQALGIIALQASPNSDDHLTFASAPVVRLRQLQCADGGFTPELITGNAKCVSTPDATGFAVQALATVPNADAVLGQAQHYLEKAQKANGTYDGEAGNSSNSTALAATGLQTLITALRSETVDPPGPKTIAPITNYQAALGGLHTFAVSAGGYGISDATAPDVRASTQAVLAAAQDTLVTLSGAPIASTPRDAFVADPGNPPAGGTPPSTDPDGATPNGSADNPIAETGVTAGTQLGWALALLLLGIVLAFAGRRRVVDAVGRHRPIRTR